MGEGLFLLDQVESFEKEKDLQKEILGAGFLSIGPETILCLVSREMELAMGESR